MTVEAPDDRDKPTPDWKRPPEPPIHSAARKGDIAQIADLIESGADIETRADLEFDNGPHLNNLTPLMVAARSIDGATVDTLRWLVEHGADIHARSAGGNTAAWYAAGHGGRWDFHRKAVTPDHVERLRYLLDQGLDPTERNFIGRSLITEACEAGDPMRVRLLLERGAPAVLRGKPSLQPSIMKRISAMASNDQTEPRADVPKGEASSFHIPLFCAARSGSAECVRLILKAGADPNTRDSSGSTALMVAGSGEVVRTLLEAGTDIHAVDEYGSDAFESILEGGCDTGACGPERFDVAQALVEAGIDIERVDQYGKTRLASAAFGHHADAVAFLLKLGARHDVRDPQGRTPLHSICWQGEYQDEGVNAACEQIIRTLVAAGVPVDAVDNDGRTPMHDAAYGDWGNPTAVRTLLALGAAVDPVNNDGDTPLMLAADNGEVECIRLLLEAGANPTRLNESGNAPLDAARNHLEVWKRIIAEGPDVSLAEIQKESMDRLAEEFGHPLEDGRCELPSILKEQTEHHEAALRDAEMAFEALRNAATAWPA